LEGKVARKKEEYRERKGDLATLARDIPHLQVRGGRKQSSATLNRK
jgi:hypothetical protein